jgi:hypothetical protein
MKEKETKREKRLHCPDITMHACMYALGERHDKEKQRAWAQRESKTAGLLAWVWPCVCRERARAAGHSQSALNPRPLSPLLSLSVVAAPPQGWTGVVQPTTQPIQLAARQLCRHCPWPIAPLALNRRRCISPVGNPGHGSRAAQLPPACALQRQAERRPYGLRHAARSVVGQRAGRVRPLPSSRGGQHGPFSRTKTACFSRGSCATCPLEYLNILWGKCYHRPRECGLMGDAAVHHGVTPIALPAAWPGYVFSTAAAGSGPLLHRGVPGTTKFSISGCL